VARICQVSPATVASWIDQGHLKGHKTPTGRRRVQEVDLLEFLRAHDMLIPPELSRGGGREAVVVVEDNATFLRALVRTIETSDLDVDIAEATNGMDALLEIGRTQPALILLDFTLPDLNGYEVIERLLAPGRSLHTEVLVVTGGVRPEDEERLRKIGVKTIINKIDGMPAIIEAMKQALRRRKAA
jgi:CheY-like chemotaxis protein